MHPPFKRAWLAAGAWASVLLVAACEAPPEPAAGRRSLPDATVVEGPARTDLGADDAEPPADPTDAAPPAVAPPPIQPLSAGAKIEDERNSISVFRAVAPSTVFVTQNKTVRDRFSLRPLEVPSGSGTGFVWDDKGHVVTNLHVIDNASSVVIELQDGSEYPAELVGSDAFKDIAVLKIDAPSEGLIPVRLPPEESPLSVGQKALAIGNPFGLDHTLTVGVISALGREVLSYGGVRLGDMIQTDASINPGNSGGPLLNSAGELIGMNTQIFSKSGQSAGIGFAVPVSAIRRSVPEIIEFGYPIRAGLGIVRFPDEIAAKAGIEGVVIQEVMQDSPADKAGLQALKRDAAGNVSADVIVGIGDEDVKKWDDLYNALDKYRPGDEVKVRVKNGDGERVVSVTLYNLPSRG